MVARSWDICSEASTSISYDCMSPSHRRRMGDHNSTLSPSNNEAYRNWFYRGFQYTFVGVIGLEEAFATLGHRYPDSPGLAQVIVSILLKSSASGMFAIGILYMLMRLLFLNKLWERVDASYQQEIEEMRRHQSV